MAACLHHRRGALRRVLALEDAAADEDAIAAELHEEPDVGGGGEAARGEGDHGQPARVADLLDELDGDAQLLRRDRGEAGVSGEGSEATASRLLASSRRPSASCPTAILARGKMSGHL